jgi:hypothetical protein
MASDGIRRWRSERSGGSPQRRPGGGPIRKAVIGSGLVGYSWLAGGTAPFSTKALLSVLVPGAVLGAIAYGRPPERVPAPDRLDLAGFSYWIIAVAALFEWEASAFTDNSAWWHPSLTNLITPALGPQPVKSAAVLLWLLAGWGLVKR